MRRENTGDKIFSIFNVIVLIILCLLMIYPIFYVVGRSLMLDVERAARPFALIPKAPSFLAYQFIFMKGSYIINAYIITIARTVIGTFCNIFLTCILAYVLSKRYYPLRVFLTFMVIITMWFNGGLVPEFLLMRSLHLSNTFGVYIFPGLKACPNHAFSYVEDDDEPIGGRIEIDLEKCESCGKCAELCCGHCIEMR